jgi:hypothetical protein
MRILGQDRGGLHLLGSKLGNMAESKRSQEEKQL